MGALQGSAIVLEQAGIIKGFLNVPVGHRWTRPATPIGRRWPVTDLSVAG
ncbi:MAG: hypothetical protein O2780_14230 [Proteobacteria bacterium]|nr:hypothetical protein [Pseudomonadota bacterium]